MNGPDVLTGAAWREFCTRLAALGDRLLDDSFPGSERDRAEGYRHLANQLACWLTYGLGHTDPERPAFFRSSDPVYRWGGPNVDQVARRAMISADGTYRIVGSMGSCEEFVLQVKAGAVQTGGADVVLELAASDLGYGPGDDFEIVLGAAPVPAFGHRFPLDPTATFVHVRDYYFDWQPREPATFVIERVDSPGEPPAPVTAAAVAALLDDAARQVEHSMVFWRDYQERMRAAQAVNAFGPAAPAGRGVQDIIYSHAFIALAEGESLLVEFDPAAAGFWGIQLFNRAWYEPLDYVNRSASINHRQAHIDDGGQVRVIIGPGDPGVANWLDTEGRDEVLCTIRWFRPAGTPRVDVRIVDLTQAAGALPPGTPVVDAAARHAALAARARHNAWRYRT